MSKEMLQKKSSEVELMACSKEVVELIVDICENDSIPKNVRITLEEVRTLFSCAEIEIGIKVDSAMQAIENVALDPNLSAFARMKIWNLTSILETLEA